MRRPLFSVAPLALIAAPLSAQPASSEILGRLPDGPEKRQFIIDCTNCHQFGAQHAFGPTGAARTVEQWTEIVERMLRFSGAHTGFPIMSAGRDARQTAEYLRRYFGDPAPRPPARPGASKVTQGQADITTYRLPFDRDLPHDIAIDSSGAVIITGMMSHTMFVLDTGARRFDPVAIPVERANPRAVEVAANGDWWVVLGGPGQLARYRPSEKTWSLTSTGMYAHSVAIDRAGRPWFNGHFTRDPAQIGVVTESGAVRLFDAPAHPTMARVPGGPIPYELRVGPDGRVWTSELQGNRLHAFTPATGHWETFTMPLAISGPRRIAVASDGRVWIPAYSANGLYMLDPRTRTFTRHEMPDPDAVPYIARHDARRGVVWVGTNASDAIYSFDIGRRTFTRYGLPEAGAVIRHLVVDPRNGDIWLAYGASPGIPARVERLRPR